MKRVLVLTISLIFLQSCSLTRIGYNFADWLIKREILSYVKLYQRQQEKLEAELDEYMAWHEKVMMPKYIQDLQQMEQIISAKNFQASQAPQIVEEAFITVKKRYIESFIPLAMRITPILSTLNDIQIQRTREILAKKFNEMRADKTKITLKERHDMVKKNLEEWIGPLSLEQAAWLDKNVSLLHNKNQQKKVITKKGQRRKTFLDIFDIKDTQKRTDVQRDFWKAYEKDFQSIDDQRPAIKLTAELVALTSEKQREHLGKKLAYYRKIIKNIID